MSVPPVLVLGAHRSGTSAITGLLARAAKLRLGDVMPPTEANPKGYFESAEVVRAHNRILGQLDRDWTCPPSWFDPSGVDTRALAECVAVLDRGAGRWGVKDPRMLFMLPAWAEILPSVQFVGVIRDHEEVVRSLMARDGIDSWVAEGIARAHVQRLRVLREQWDFPIIDFSADRAQTLADTRSVAAALDLDWDDRIAHEFLEEGLATSRGRGTLTNADADALRELGVGVVEPDVVESTELAAFLSTRRDDTEELDRHSGPRASVRRRRTWSAVPRDFVAVTEVTRNRKVASSSQPARDDAEVVEAHDLLTLYDQLRRIGPSEALVLPDMTSWVQPDDLSAALELASHHVGSFGLVVVGLSSADRDVATSRGWVPVTVDDLVAAARDAGFLPLKATEDDVLTVVRLMRRPALGSGQAVMAKAGAVAAHGPQESWRQRYLRLRNRRSVRAALAVAAIAKPAVDLARRVRRSMSPG